MNDEGQVDEWKERIILTAIPFGDGGARIKVDSPTPDINIDVQRRSCLSRYICLTAECLTRLGLRVPVNEKD